MLVKCQNCPHLFDLPNLWEVIISTLLGEAVSVMLKQGGCAALSTCLHWTHLLFSPCCFSVHPDRCEGVQVHHRFFLFFPSVDDKVPRLVGDISCLTVASCLVTFRLLLVWRLWGPFDLQHYWSGCTPWQGPNDYFSSSLWVMSEETHFVLLSHCWEIYLFLNFTDFICS